jgi:predicted DNA-binding protein YlxM (UPF0122 family)
MKDLIGTRMSELPEKEQLVLVLYYYEELTLKEIGEILDVTESRVCQIHTKAILRLKGKIERHEGKTSIGQITRQIQREQQEQEDKAKASKLVEQTLENLESVNITACLSLFHICTFLTWMAKSGGWPGTVS